MGQIYKLNYKYIFWVYFLPILKSSIYKISSHLIYSKISFNNNKILLLKEIFIYLLILIFEWEMIMINHIEYNIKSELNILILISSSKFAYSISIRTTCTEKKSIIVILIINNAWNFSIHLNSLNSIIKRTVN